MIGVVGASGTTGRALLEVLAREGAHACAIVRDIQVLGDAFPTVARRSIDTASARSSIAALIGVRALFLAMANGPNQKANELSILHAAVQAGVEHIVKVSAPVVGDDVPVAIARMHGEIEQVIETSGISFTHLRPYAFMSNLLGHAATIREMGVFFGCTGDAPINWVAPSDVAEVAFAGLTRPDLRGQALVLTGPEAVSMPEVARMLEAIAVHVTYVDETPADLGRSLTRRGLPAWLVTHVLEIQALSVARRERPTDTVARVLGRPPCSLESYLEANRAAFIGEPELVPALFGRMLALRARFLGMLRRTHDHGRERG